MHVFDGHTDIMADVVKRRKMGESDVFRRHHLDKLAHGKVMGANFVYWMDPQKATLADLVEGLALIREEVVMAGDVLHMVNSMKDFEEAAERDKLAVVLGMEGLAAIGADIHRIPWLFEQGIRCASLTWNESNDLATGIAGDVNRGLTKAGQVAVGKMEELGILLDASHLNEKSFWDVMNRVSKPIVASHSNAWSLCQHTRNLKDDQLKIIAETGGLVGVNAVGDFLAHEHANLNHFVHQVDYMVSLVGIDHVSLGFDFCDFLGLETEKSPEERNITADLETSRDVQKAIRLLTEKGYHEDEVQKLAKDNYMRLYRAHLS